MAIFEDSPTGRVLLPYAAVAAVILYPIYHLYVNIYRLFFSPLSKIPGPWATRISAVPEAKALKKQQRTQWLWDLFAERSGAVAIRTSPNAVSFNHPDAIKAIYGHGKSVDGFGKSSWYDAFSTTGESMFSTRSKNLHAMKRRMVSHGFSSQALHLFEPLIDQTLEKFMGKMDEFARTGESFEIYFWFELFTMDLMGELALGNNFGAIEAGEPARYSWLVEQSQRFAFISGLFPFGKSNVTVLSWIPFPNIQRLYQARLEYLEFARQALEKRFQDDRKKLTPSGKVRQDIMQRFIEAEDPETGHKMDFAELRAETSSLMVAGASTGSVTMNWMTYYLCRNPSIKTRLIKSLEDMFPENTTGTQPLSFTKLQRLALLENTELECLRLHPPLGYSLPRDTPPQGAVICGHYIPGGVAVGVPAAIIGRNENVYKNPHTWDPDRWTDESADLATMKTCFLGFGYGSRQCIGRNVANQFIMKMMATLLLRYDVELENPALLLGTKEFTIQKPDKAYKVILRPRAS